MHKMNMLYFEEADILHLAISDEPEANSVEISPNITVELNDKGDIIGVEIVRASSFIRDMVLDAVPTKLLQSPMLQPAL